jgi:hypothetical protein
MSRAARLIASGAVYFFQMRSMGGAVADVPVDATAFAHRSARYQLNAFGTDRARLDARSSGPPFAGPVIA